MLSVTLKEGDYLMIGSDIRLHIQKGMYDNTVKLGIDAPKTIPVLRGEVYERQLAKDGSEKLEENEKIKRDFRREIKRFSNKRKAIQAAGTRRTETAKQKSGKNTR